ncbi:MULTISPECIES: hypothetical protein [unclassified Legionella]|uniref:hypothetical protein n=1 Tax=unclassified Legionella TaxID=2622702 RepID=UPI001E44FCC6|nr:hypothetical protein [Legionella sp. 31fI33]MCC5014558.1 hypothetical protein [Legionella sp. 31fI33]
MSNFLQVAKIILARRIKQIRNDSVSADTGLTNRAVTFFSLGFLGRDKALSATKQDLDDDLLSELNDVQDGENDEATLETLKTLISKYKNSAKIASSKKGYDEGTSGPALQAVITLLDDIYKKLEDAEKEGVKLLDTPDDETPLNVYRYQTIRYLAQKVEDAGNQSLINKLLQNPKISSCHELAEEKEKILIANLKQCEENIRELNEFEEIARREAERAKKAMEEAKKVIEDEDIDDAEIPKPSKILVEKKPVDYPALRKKSVLSSLKALKEENETLCERFGPKISLPVSVIFFTSLSIALPTFKPGPGYLQECAEAAVSEINPPEVIQVSICTL